MEMKGFQNTENKENSDSSHVPIHLQFSTLHSSRIFATVSRITALWLDEQARTVPVRVR